MRLIISILARNARRVFARETETKREKERERIKTFVHIYVAAQENVSCIGRVAKCASESQSSLSHQKWFHATKATHRRMHTYVGTHTHRRTHTHTHRCTHWYEAHTHTQTHAHMHARICRHTHRCMHTHNIHRHTHTHTDARTHTRTHTNAQVQKHLSDFAAVQPNVRWEKTKTSSNPMNASDTYGISEQQNQNMLQERTTREREHRLRERERTLSTFMLLSKRICSACIP